MKRTYSLVLVGVLALAPVARAVNRIVTTESPTGANSLTAAINALVNGDTITFNIPPGTGEVHYILTPPDGYPLITNNNITIDGYTQPGATYNTASIHAPNNANLKIVLTSTNENGLSMYSACTNSWGSDIPNLGFGDAEIALLGFFHATNATVRGLCFQASPFAFTTQAPNIGGDPSDGPFCKSICFACNSQENGGGNCKNFNVKGCWFGLDPVYKTNATFYEGSYIYDNMAATPAMCVASYNTYNADGNNSVFNSGTIGVAPGSTNAQADFNIFITGYGFDSNEQDLRFSGNFWNVLPDGVTAVDISTVTTSSWIQQGDGYIEVGSSDSNLIIGTDGDGVNDAQEGNIFAPLPQNSNEEQGESGTCINLWGQNNATNIVVAGNYFGLNVYGVPFDNIGTNVNPLVDNLIAVSTFRFGSDFNGVSDALEANWATNAILFAMNSPTPPGYTNGWISMRGNSLGGCSAVVSAGVATAPLGDGQASGAGQSIYAGFIDISGGAANIIPVFGPATTTTSLQGTCGQPVAGSPYTRLVVDLYEAADPTVNPYPQGKRWIASFTDNSAADSNPAVGAFTFNTTGLGITSGMNLTMTVTYSKDTVPTITSVARTGTQTTLNVTGGTGMGPTVTYGVQKSATVSPTSWSYAAAAAGVPAVFTDTDNPRSIYKATGPSGTGQTSPFSAVFSVP